MGKLVYFLVLLFSVFPIVGVASANEEQEFNAKLVEIRNQYAPDSRLEFFSVKVDGHKAAVETTSPEARTAVLELAGHFPSWEVSVMLLPEENSELEGKWRAIVNFSTIQIQAKPDYASELCTQALMGAPARVLKKYNGYWILIQTYDGYIGYTTAGSIRAMTKEEFASWRESRRLVWLENYGAIYSEPDLNSQTISDLVAGNVVVWRQEEDSSDFYSVVTPLGRRGWILKKGAMEWSRWIASRELSPENLIASARSLLGRPYIWGGLSPKGVDCSGLINFAFATNGYNILRDVSQIRREGINVDLSLGWNNFKPGDLLIFGNVRDNGSTHWRHVGIYLGGGRFIHSATFVHESSLNPDDSDYDPGNARQLIKVVRMIGAPETEHFHPIADNKFFDM